MGSANILLQSADSIAKLMYICLQGMTSVNGSSEARTGACRKKRRNVNAKNSDDKEEEAKSFDQQ